MPVIFRLDCVLSFYRIFLSIIKTFIRCRILRQFCGSYISYNIQFHKKAKKKKKKKEATVQTNIRKKKNKKITSTRYISSRSAQKRKMVIQLGRKKSEDKEKTKI